MKVHKHSIVAVMLILTIMSDSAFFYTSINDRIRNTLLLFATLFATVFLCKKKIREMQRKYRTLMFIWGCSWIFLLVYTVIKFPQTNITILIFTSSYWIMPLLSLTFTIIALHSRDGYKKILRCVNYYVFALYILLILQKVAFETAGIVFLPFYSRLITSTNVYREFGVRLGMRGIENFMVIYNIFLILNKDKLKVQKLNYINFGLGLYCVIVIQQTRAYIISFIITVSIILLQNALQKKRFIKSLILLCLGAAILISTNLLSDIIGSLFSTTESYGADQMVRVDAINYFIQYFLKNPIGGFGFADGNTYASIVHGPLLRYWVNDIGLIGLLAQGGLLIILPVFLLFVWMIKTISKLKHVHRITEERKFMIICIWYIISTSISLSIFDENRILVAALIIGIFGLYTNTTLSDRYYLFEKRDIKI